MGVSRRGLLILAGAIPAAALSGRAIGIVADAVGKAAQAARPGGNGTSATRCAQCGASEHTMLDPRCPLAPRVLG